MTSQAVEAVELQVKGKIRLPEEAFQPVRPHLANIHEEHVPADEGQDRLRLLPGEAEPPEDRGRNLFPPLDMAVEMDSGFIFGTGDRLADVVEENRPGETQVGLSILSGREGRASAAYVPRHPPRDERPGAVRPPGGP